ncbi:TRAP-type C4-dicarboxylate transport system permease small subunit [Rhodovulum sulfidophilum]|uniref:TRAP transporter small permease n=1 Tax=Rhodovulum sulfidophilum TaxID=35806 RepID=UPI0005A7A172|nr:TRAP transporter small permease [Rhodovulum sulfidophilum]ANB33417.1 C4-dicarboxylate ABC transporter permease [Rhodovulum sulfidophilum DSM 1374]ANB37238.1 C4-dicarboxylate ABC transporter permease [Rhodovulum sulfidophilum]MCW2304347.1 TRAP-type C4-dicarboxylate transport system permease small subunit [Rhodovulum sulfidophilum]
MLPLIERALLMLRRLVSAVVILLFSVMMAAVLIQIAGRYIFNYSIAQASEIATFCQIWLVLLGAGVAMARGQHVAIDMVPARFSLPWARAALIFIALVSAAFLAVLAWGSQPLLRMGAFQTSPSLQMPMAWMYLCLPVGAAYIALELLLSVILRWNDPFPPPSLDHEEEAI